MKEIEVAYELHESLETAKNKLSNFEIIKEEKVYDTYFYDPDKKSSKPFRNNLGECLRIRSINKEHTVNYKIDKFDEDGKWLASDKYEQKVESLEDVLKNFNASNLKELISLEKLRIKFAHEKYTIYLEEIKELGCFFEINYTQEIDKDIQDIKKEMKDFAKSLNLEINETIKMGKPEMLLKKLGLHIK